MEVLRGGTLAATAPICRQDVSKHHGGIAQSQKYFYNEMIILI